MGFFDDGYDDYFSIPMLCSLEVEPYIPEPFDFGEGLVDDPFISSLEADEYWTKNK